MFTDSTPLGCIIVLIITSWLPLAMSAYEDLGSLCLGSYENEDYKSVQPNISYSATPYPLVTKDNNITLTCVGRSVHGDFATSPGDESYMTDVEFYKNGGMFYSCQEEQFRYVRRLSCNVTVTGVTNHDKFMCVIRASNAPCNAAQISFEIVDRVAPNVSSLFPTFKYDATKIEVTCVGVGIPEPNVAWLLNGSMINHTNTAKTINAEIETKLADVQNGTNVYRVNSKIVITGREFPLRIQCVVMNETLKVYSKNVYALYVEVMVVKLSTATVRWRVYPQMNNSFVSTAGYNVSLKCGKECFEENRVCNKSSVTFSHLTLGRAYTVKVQASSYIGDLAIGAVEFYSPDKLPRPNNIYAKNITSQKAVIGWESISADNTVNGVLQGYKLVLVGKNRKKNFTLTSNKREVVLPHLIRKSEYTVSVYGFTQYGDGRILEHNFTTLDFQEQTPNNNGGENDEHKKGKSSSTLTIVSLPVAIIAGVIIVLIVYLALLRIRARKTKKPHNQLN